MPVADNLAEVHPSPPPVGAREQESIPMIRILHKQWHSEALTLVSIWFHWLVNFLSREGLPGGDTESDGDSLPFSFPSSFSSCSLETGPCTAGRERL